MKLSQKMMAGLALLLVSSQAHAMKAMVLEGGRVGNGGGLVVCRDAKGIKSVEVLDFYEAKKLRNWSLEFIAGSSWQEKVGEMIRRLGTKSPFRVELYGRWLNTFESEMRILDSVEFSKIPDSAHVAVPQGCDFEQGAIQVPPRFSGDKRYYINAALWNAMDDTQKAGLVFHELIYREAIAYGHSDSISVRFLNGLINSANLKATSEEQWIKTLRQAKFEMTDVKFPSEGFVSRIDLTKLMGSSEVADQPELFEMVGRAPILLGLCQGESCSEYRPHTPQEFSQLSPFWSLHPWVRGFSFPGADVSMTGDRPDWFLEVTPYLDRFRTNKMGNSVQFPEYQFMAVKGTFGGRKFQGYVDEVRYERFNDGSKDIASLLALQIEMEKANGKTPFKLSSYVTCFAGRMNFAQNNANPGSTLLRSVTLHPLENVRCHDPHSGSLSFDSLQVSFTDRNAIYDGHLHGEDMNARSIEFDEEGKFIRGGVYYRMDFASDPEWSSTTYHCDLGISGCGAEFNEKGTPVISVRSLIWAHFETRRGPQVHLYVAKGQEVETYSSGIPKAVTIGGRSIVRDVDGRDVVVEAGSRVHFNSEGYATRIEH